MIYGLKKALYYFINPHSHLWLPPQFCQRSEKKQVGLYAGQMEHIYSSESSVFIYSKNLKEVIALNV